MKEQTDWEHDPFQGLLHAVHETCDVERCCKILDGGVDVNATTRAGCTPLMFAAMPNEYGDHNSPGAMLQIVKVLLSRGADPKLTDKFGMTAADYARQLIDPDWKDRFGQPCAGLWDAVERSTIGEIIALLEAGEDSADSFGDGHST